MPEPKHNRGKSRQDFQTPPEFILAVNTKWELSCFDIDLAASKDNTQARDYYTIEDDALVQPWKIGSGVNWCNPEFSILAPWVGKGLQEWKWFQAHTLMLLPASVGADWFKTYVHRKPGVFVYFLNGRLTFVGHSNCYPKDCMLVEFGAEASGYDVWNWREDAA